MRRLIIYAPSCDMAAALLGGYEQIDRSLDAAIHGLIVNPYSFPLIESDYYRARYIPTISQPDLPALVWIFIIDVNNNVMMVHVEEFEGY